MNVASSIAPFGSILIVPSLLLALAACGSSNGATSLSPDANAGSSGGSGGASGLGGSLSSSGGSSSSAGTTGMNSGGSSSGGASLGGTGSGGSSAGGSSSGGARSGGSSAGGSAPGGSGGSGFGGSSFGGASSAGSSSGGSNSGGSGSGGSGSGGSPSGGSRTGGASSGGSSSGGSSSAGSTASIYSWNNPVQGGPAVQAPVTGTVTVTRASSAGTVASGFAGFSYEKTHMTNNSFTGKNAALIALHKLVAPTVVRIGATDVNNCTWVPAAQPQVAQGSFSKSIGTVDVDGLADLMSATGDRVIYGINFVANDPTNSAAEATYAFGKLGSSLYGFEIGNEMNQVGTWPGTLKPQWESIANAILASLPSAKMVGPAASGPYSLSLTTPFAADEKGKNLVLLTGHYYAGTRGRADGVLATLLAPNTSTGTSGLLGFLTNTNAAAVKNSIPDGYRVGECNTFGGHGVDGLSNALISALWGIDFMFYSALHGASGVNFHGGEKGQDGNNPFYYSPIEELNGVVTNVNPLFYGMVLFNLVGTGHLLATTATASGDSNFTAYANQRTDGTVMVVLDNKDETKAVNATVNVGATVTSASAIYLMSTPASLTAQTGITLAGAGIGKDGSWKYAAPYALSTSGSSVIVPVPPASAVLVRVL
jgi:hypothetical protein